ncbi:unnamed protein product [Adineta ricciae]|uniref:Uncharacterized protein n=1 Tax=Adineta ricciae TaxID=249248 RepID=A0A815ERR4_ADIRI|nr:unnamed protein product [Adineta ricciae]CAF1337747.1 unnamed protein product [Adineta ricciae]
MTVLSSILFLLIPISNALYPVGIINHQTQWHIHCENNYTQIVQPPLNNQILVPYTCPVSSLAIEILPIELDLTFLCRSQSRLIWIIIDLYQYQTWPMSINSNQVNISLVINHEFRIKDYKSEINQYDNRFVLINAFYIPFESLNKLLDRSVEVFIEINQCQFFIRDNFTWNDVLQSNCNSFETRSLLAQSGQCNFFPKLVSTTSNDNTTEIPDFHVVLSIDQEKPIETTTALSEYQLLFDEHYQKILIAIWRATHLLKYVFIFTTIILILLTIFCIYILCYHFRHRVIQRSSLLI